MIPIGDLAVHQREPDRLHRRVACTISEHEDRTSP